MAAEMFYGILPNKRHLAASAAILDQHLLKSQLGQGCLGLQLQHFHLEQPLKLKMVC